MWSNAAYLPGDAEEGLAIELRNTLEGILPISRLNQEGRESELTWSSLSELGVFTIGLPESWGGSGLGVVEEVLIANELGRRVTSPFVLTSLGLSRVLQENNLIDDNMHALVTPGRRSGKQAVFIEDENAKFLLLCDENNGNIYPYPRNSRKLDSTTWKDELHGVNIESLGAPLFSLTRKQMLFSRLIFAAALAGIAQTATDVAVQYACTREQFGRPIGSFQAIKHHCSNMALLSRSARDQVRFAAVSFSGERDDAEFQIECSFHAAAVASVSAAEKNIQIHGGIGFSEEAVPHVLLKRAKLLVLLCGGIEEAIARISTLNVEI